MKNKKILIGVVLLVLVLALLLVGAKFFTGQKKTQDSFQDKMQEINQKQWEQTGEFSQEEDRGITFELALIDKCDRGEWIVVKEGNDIADAREFPGFVVGDEKDGKEEYAFEDGRKLFFSKIEYGQFFEDRDVVVLAQEVEGGLDIFKAKCLEDNKGGDEMTNPVTDATKDFEQTTMEYLQSSIANLTKKSGQWEVVSFLWPNEQYVYVEFAAVDQEDAEVGETLDDEETESFLLLLKVAAQDSEVATEEIGLLKLDEDDEWIAERGRDLFDDVDEGRLFDFDPDLGRWVKIN